MPGPRPLGVRLRQAVLVARDLEPACGRLAGGLGLGAPFHDPGVGLFGLRNAVYALGEDFLEVVSPEQEGTAAGRQLERRGDGGYMLIFQVDDLAAARARAERLGITKPALYYHFDSREAPLVWRLALTSPAQRTRCRLAALWWTGC